MGLGLGPACVLLSALTPASCFFTGTTAVVSRIAPRDAPSSMNTAIAMAAPIAWPDEVTTPSLDQPIRARILAVAPGGVASPFKDRGKAVPWIEVCHVAGSRFAKAPDRPLVVVGNSGKELYTKAIVYISPRRCAHDHAGVGAHRHACQVL